MGNSDGRKGTQSVCGRCMPSCHYVRSLITSPRTACCFRGGTLRKRDGGLGVPTSGLSGLVAAGTCQRVIGRFRAAFIPARFTYDETNGSAATRLHTVPAATFTSAERFGLDVLLFEQSHIRSRLYAPGKVEIYARTARLSPRKKARQQIGGIMKIAVKSFDVNMEIKNKGVELAVYSPDGKTFLGDLVITKSGVIWCAGKTRRASGKSLSWKKFMELMAAQ